MNLWLIFFFFFRNFGIYKKMSRNFFYLMYLSYLEEDHFRTVPVIIPYVSVDDLFSLLTPGYKWAQWSVNRYKHSPRDCTNKVTIFERLSWDFANISCDPEGLSEIKVFGTIKFSLTHLLPGPRPSKDDFLCLHKHRCNEDGERPLSVLRVSLHYLGRSTTKT